MEASNSIVSMHSLSMDTASPALGSYLRLSQAMMQMDAKFSCQHWLVGQMPVAAYAAAAATCTALPSGRGHRGHWMQC